MSFVVAIVGEAHGLAADWLNDRAAMFAPATFDANECLRLLDHGVTSAAEVAETFFAGFPHAPDDPYLATFIVESRPRPATTSLPTNWHRRGLR